MTAEQRRPYDEKAKTAKKSTGGVKYNTLGEPVNFVLRKEQTQQIVEKNMREHIENLFINGTDYITKPFYVCYVNYYCFYNIENRYIPAEISIVRFNLKDGIDLNDIFHILIDSTIPLGYTLEARINTEQTHQIPLPPHSGTTLAEMSENMRNIIPAVLSFLAKNLDPNDCLPPIYVEDKNIAIAKDVFKRCLSELYYDENKIRIYSLSYFFYSLRNVAHFHAFNKQAFPNESIAQYELEKDVYGFVLNIACEYHNITDAYFYCSLSQAIRKIFIICDHVCKDLQIEMIPGHHLAKNANIDKSAMSTPSTSSRFEESYTTNINEQYTSEENDTGSTSSVSAANLVLDASKTNAQKNNLIDACCSLTNWTNLRTFSQRLPRTTSKTQGITQHTSNSTKNSQELGADNKPPVIGRGRGRILNFASKK